MALYLQAIGMLMQPPLGKTDVRVGDHCRAAQIMNNLADVISRAPPPATIHQAALWAQQARDIIVKTRGLPGAAADAEGMAVCEQTLAAVLFNLGALLEVRSCQKNCLV